MSGVNLNQTTKLNLYLIDTYRATFLGYMVQGPSISLGAATRSNAES